MLQQQYNGLAVKGLHKRIGKVSTAVSLTLVGLMAQMPAWAAGALEGEVKKQPLNISAIIMFLIFVFATLGITYWASKQNKTKPLATFIPRAAVSQVPKTESPLPATICQR